MEPLPDKPTCAELLVSVFWFLRGFGSVSVVLRRVFAGYSRLKGKKQNNGITPQL